jgi:hypothetical protein
MNDMCPICLIRVVHTPPYFEVGSLHPTSGITLLSVWWFFSLHRIWSQIFVMAIFFNLTHHPDKLPIQTMQNTISSDLTKRKNWLSTSFYMMWNFRLNFKTFTSWHRQMPWLQLQSTNPKWTMFLQFPIQENLHATEPHLADTVGAKDLVQGMC